EAADEVGVDRDVVVEDKKVVEAGGEGAAETGVPAGGSAEVSAGLDKVHFFAPATAQLFQGAVVGAVIDEKDPVGGIVDGEEGAEAFVGVREVVAGEDDRGDAPRRRSGFVRLGGQHPLTLTLSA